VNIFIFGILVMLAGGIFAVLFSRHPRAASMAGAAGTITGSLICLFPVWSALGGGVPAETILPWSMPFGALTLALDPLSAFFCLPTLIVCSLCALYGYSYLAPCRPVKNLGLHWFFYAALAASILLVLVARNALFFLLAWELMALSSFFLVMFEHEKPAVRQAGWIYMIATHLGTGFLLVMFFVMGRSCGSLDFRDFTALAGQDPAANLVFGLALIGFGTKAGFMPLHVWLPEAHPAAPSHVSAVLSGVMIKTGIYGIVRVVSFCGPPPVWWGWTLLGIGIMSGVLGVVFALAQHDLKRLLAYSSVENIGIIAVGLGLGLLGVHYRLPLVAFLGFAGGLLHVLNHAFFKSLLFLGAGSVLHSAGTGEIDRLGGLSRKMPFTGITFMVGAAAICGLPPLNGFLGEFLIYLGAFLSVASHHGLPLASALGGAAAGGALALIGALAVACFTKAYGAIFLGGPRQAGPYDNAHETGWNMRIATLTLAGFCISIGLAGPWIIGLMPPVVLAVLPGLDPMAALGNWGDARIILGKVWTLSMLLLVVTGIFLWFRRFLLSGREVRRVVTWDCGYAAPTARMQYTASSFAAPVAGLFRLVLRSKLHADLPHGIFPENSHLHSKTTDVFREKLFRPWFAIITWAAGKVRLIQQGQLQLYILYIVITILVLLFWKLR
jgi:formate hydrogenlyase subunit 3/multisubunit Na+/H+ antiporter MnhD subunit